METNKKLATSTYEGVTTDNGDLIDSYQSCGAGQSDTDNFGVVAKKKKKKASRAVGTKSKD